MQEVRFEIEGRVFRIIADAHQWILDEEIVNDTSKKNVKRKTYLKRVGYYTNLEHLFFRLMDYLLRMEYTGVGYLDDLVARVEQVGQSVKQTVREVFEEHRSFFTK